MNNVIKDTSFCKLMLRDYKKAIDVFMETR